jgi:hypothetical protein
MHRPRRLLCAAGLAHFVRICVVSSSAARSTAVNLVGHFTASVGRPITPLRSPHVLRSGGSPHAGETSSRFPSTLLRPGSPSYKEIIAFGGIPDYSNTGLRSTSRIQAQPNADVPQMELAARWTPSSLQGTNCIKKLNFIDLPDCALPLATPHPALCPARTYLMDRIGEKVGVTTPRLALRPKSLSPKSHAHPARG